MSQLRIYADQNLSQPHTLKTQHADISAALNQAGIRFEQWNAPHAIADAASTEEIIAAYQHQIDQFKQEGGFQSVDVIHMTPNHPQKEVLRQKFLQEHIHSEDEIRFFVKGSGLFYMHIADQVYAVRCEQNDLISVPTGIKHWFDAGLEPQFTAIRFFTTPDGWVAQYTGDTLATRFPAYVFS